MYWNMESLKSSIMNKLDQLRRQVAFYEEKNEVILKLFFADDF